MSDAMYFPPNFKEFIHMYSFEDRNKIYLNQGELIPVFRVLQGYEHYINLLKNAYYESNYDMHMLGHYIEKILKDMGEI